MSLKFLHTSDWQIGKVFRFADESTMGLLQEARLEAITRLGELAVEHGAGHVLVAGDVYDMEALSTRSRNQPMERMRKFEKVTWHLLPGNHDPHRRHGLWDQFMPGGVPGNVKVHLTSEPQLFESDGFAILPAPLYHKSTFQDLTAYMDDAKTPHGIIRIGLAHGTITGFGSDDKDVANLINPDRPKLAKLAYLALGDWHGQKKINDKVWYSGTHETDAFDVDGGGQALLVETRGADEAPVVTQIETGGYKWMTFREQVNSREDVDALVKTLRSCGEELSKVLVRLFLWGTMSLHDRMYLNEQIIEQVSAAFCHLQLDDTRLFPNPTGDDLDQIDWGGFVRTAAEELMQKAADKNDPDHETAALALQRMYIEHMKLQAANQ